ncbi:helix-turn-helix transcriptional regulator [Pedococcus sp. P5_B7]
MSPPDSAPDDVFVGRAEALDELASAIASARAGQGRAVLVLGDAGVGKTRLAQHACSLASDFLVLSGACLAMTSVTVPLLPLRAAVATVPPGERPTMTGVDSARTAEDFDAWLERRCAERPVALVVDDLQWADPGTLDVLMWVLAGLTPRRLALLMTVRRGELVAGHPLHGWLADVRRLPGFAEMSLGPLTLEETREQLRGVLGDVPHQSLVREVFGRTGGNAYLNRLLVRGVDPAATVLGPGVPDDLASAVLRAWHRLDLPARELSRVLAVGGRVARGTMLDHAAGLAGVTDLRSALRECVEADLLEVDTQGGYWFHHPLQAEALESSLDRPERQRLHAAFAASLELEVELGLADDVHIETLSLIAEHHHRAGQVAQAHDWALRAADQAAAAGAPETELRLLLRALAVQSEPPPPAALWQRLREVAAAAGDVQEELLAVEALLATLQPTGDALALSELLVRRQHLRFSTGQGFLDPTELGRAVELAAPEPDSWQYALALAELAHASLWQDDPAAPEIAARALERARACAHPEALAYALAANSMLAVFEDRFDDARRMGGEAVAAAAEARDGWAFVHATLWEANAVDGAITPEWRAMVGRRRVELAALGLPSTYVAWLAGNEAFGHLHAGDLDTSARLIREALGATPSALVDVQSRLNAAWLAALQGRIHEAEGHLARADELFADTSTFLAFEFDAVRAMVLLCGGHLREAVDAAVSGTALPGAPPTMCEWLLPIAARALAELVQQARDAGRDPAAELAEIDALTRAFPHVLADKGGLTPGYRNQLDGLEAMYQGEVARARRDEEAPQRWVEAATALHGVLAWEECYSLWRRAEAQLSSGQPHRDAAADALRRAHVMARELGVRPIVDELEALARGARVPLAEPPGPHELLHVAGTAGLTRRESEILGHIVAGRTYGEIARELVLSEKTVSSHVSHLLGKTGTANRVDLARWASRRSGSPDGG